jgi:hypothetical protein
MSLTSGSLRNKASLKMRLKNLGMIDRSISPKKKKERCSCRKILCRDSQDAAGLSSCVDVWVAKMRAAIAKAGTPVAR